MKPHDELLAEARRIEAAADLYATEAQRAAMAGRAFGPRVIPTFFRPPPLPRERWMEVEMVEGAIEYRLVESSGRERDQEAAPRVIFASDSAFDVLVEADEIEENESLLEKLAPVIERIDRHEFDDSLESSVVQEIEAMLDAAELDPASRLRTRAEIVDFLSGAMEPARFVAAIVERRAERQTADENLALRYDEQRVIEQP